VRAALITTALLAGLGLVGWQWLETDTPAAAAAAAPADPNLVSSVTFRGASLAAQRTRTLLETQRGDQLDAGALARDRVAVEADLQAQGFWLAQVAPATVTVGSAGAHVAYVVDRGALHRVGAVTLDGIDAALAADLRAALTLGSGDVITPVAVERNRAFIAELLARQGRRDTVTTLTTTGVGTTVDVTYRIAR